MANTCERTDKAKVRTCLLRGNGDHRHFQAPADGVGYCPLLGADHPAAGSLLHAAADEHAQEQPATALPSSLINVITIDRSDADRLVVRSVESCGGVAWR